MCVVRYDMYTENDDCLLINSYINYYILQWICSDTELLWCRLSIFLIFAV